MKICWDNLEDIKLTSKGTFSKRNKTSYVYKESCKLCGEPYLTVKGKQSDYCCCRCCYSANRDLVGLTFGRLYVEKRSKRQSKRTIYVCKCICGNTCEVLGNSLKGGLTKSCGCIRKETARAQFIRLSKGKFGVDSLRYKPNLTDEDRERGRFMIGYKEWRKTVYELDNYTCQKCGDSKGGNLNAHHIESYADNPKLRIEVSNGITFCEDCHKDFHHQFGHGNDRTQLIKFLRGSIC